MPTRYGDEAQSRSWAYPSDAAGFLAAIGTNLDEPREARTRVELFLLTHAGPRMPASLRAELLAKGLITGPAPTRLDGDRRI